LDFFKVKVIHIKNGVWIIEIKIAFTYLNYPKVLNNTHKISLYHYHILVLVIPQVSNSQAPKSLQFDRQIAAPFSLC